MNDIEKILEKEIETLSDEELCEAHAYWWGKVMYHSCAEGHYWHSESSLRHQAERECDKYGKFVEERSISFGWESRGGTSNKVYRKNDEIIYER